MDVIAPAWRLEDDGWPGEYSYWYDFALPENRGGGSGVVACSCSHGPCEEPCGGPDQAVRIPARSRREWQVPVEINVLAPGGHTFKFDVRWREQIAPGRTRDASHEAEYHLAVGQMIDGCAQVRLGDAVQPISRCSGRGPHLRSETRR